MKTMKKAVEVRNVMQVFVLFFMFYFTYYVILYFMDFLPLDLHFELKYPFLSSLKFIWNQEGSG